jgi:hypothetical protein
MYYGSSGLLDFLTGGMIFLFLLCYIALSFSTAFFCRWLAGQKSYSTTAWFWLGFLFGVIPVIILAGAPDLQLRRQLNVLVKGNSKLTAANSPNKPFIVETQKRCRRCGKTCDLGYTGCPHCGAVDFE